jgi:hypothetical protein
MKSVGKDMRGGGHGLLEGTITVQFQRHQCYCCIYHQYVNLIKPYDMNGLLLWSSVQSSCLQIHRSRVRFLALPDFLRSSGSGTGSTHDTLYPQKLALISPTNGGRSVGIVRLRTKATEIFFMIRMTTYFNLYN